MAPKIPVADSPRQQGGLNRKERVVTKAVVRAAEELGLSGEDLADVIGVSPATISRLRSGQATLGLGGKDYELAVLFIRLFRSLDAIVGGDMQSARTWLRSPNTALDALPLDRVKRIDGLMHVLAYLDARRALA